MKKVLYITNIQVPYRVRFFNELAKKCDLTVLYERSQSENRNSKWANSIGSKYQQFFLDGIKVGNESTFSLKIIKYLFSSYDVIVLGCYSTPVQIFANIVMRILRKKFIMNFDGEIFANDKSMKTIVKKIVIKGASSYLIAGEQSAMNLRKIVGDKQVTPYYFSSLFDKEIKKSINVDLEKRENFILVVGQYFEYKGLDIVVEVARKMPNQIFKIVGMGKRAELFMNECNTMLLKNIKIIPFLQKDDLFEEYRRCKALILPTRQECWGLVINEAASVGTPIISTYGSGAAVEFLNDKYSELLAKPGDSESLLRCIQKIDTLNLEKYSEYLKEKSKKYSIENCVKMHIIAMELLYTLKSRGD